MQTKFFIHFWSQMRKPQTEDVFQAYSGFSKLEGKSIVQIQGEEVLQEEHKGERPLLPFVDLSPEEPGGTRVAAGTCPPPHH